MPSTRVTLVTRLRLPEVPLPSGSCLPRVVRHWHGKHNICAKIKGIEACSSLREKQRDAQIIPRAIPAGPSPHRALLEQQDWDDWGHWGRAGALLGRERLHIHP